MKAAGINLDDINKVMLTNAHLYHFAAFANKNCSKAFKNAPLALAKAEWDFIHNDKGRSALSLNLGA